MVTSYSDTIFEKVLYDRMFELFIENNLISKKNSGFTPTQVLYQVILALINLSLLLMKFINALMMTLNLELHF